MTTTTFNGYELLGDSNFVRFAAHVNKIKHVPKNIHHCRQLGLCVSGQNIRSLTRRVLTKYGKEGPKKNFIVLIGTNDLRNMTPIRTFKLQLYMLLKSMRHHNVNICTIPLPKLYEEDEKRVELWKSYNSAILKLKYNQILELSDIFLENGKVISSLYCRTYAGKNKCDWVHFNKKGLEKMATFFKAILPAIP